MSTVSIRGMATGVCVCMCVCVCVCVCVCSLSFSHFYSLSHFPFRNNYNFISNYETNMCLTEKNMESRVAWENILKHVDG